MFKVGQKVRATKDCGLLEEGEYVVKEVDGELYIESNCFKCTCSDTWKLVEPVEKTWDNLEKGDVIFCQKYGHEFTVLAKVDEVYCLSTTQFKRVSRWFTIEEMQDLGWKIKQPEQKEKIEEMTVEQVCKALGKTIKIVK